LHSPIGNDVGEPESQTFPAGSRRTRALIPGHRRDAYDTFRRSQDHARRRAEGIIGVLACVPIPTKGDHNTVFVPEGQHDSSQARSAWKRAPKEPSRRVRYDRARLVHEVFLVEMCAVFLKDQIISFRILNFHHRIIEPARTPARIIPYPPGQRTFAHRSASHYLNSNGLKPRADCVLPLGFGQVSIGPPHYSRTKMPNETGPISRQPSRYAAPCTSNGCKELILIISLNGAVQARSAGLMATMISSAPANRR
jgi:hypothetical protein